MSMNWKVALRSVSNVCWQATSHKYAHNFSTKPEKANEHQQSVQVKETSSTEVTPTSYKPVLPSWMKPLDVWLQKHILEYQWVCAYVRSIHKNTIHESFQQTHTMNISQ